jgi:RNA polymerase primary sigma factor
MLPDEQADDPTEMACASSTRARVMSLLNTLPERDKRVLMLRFGIGCDAMTLEEIGQRYGVTRERIRQIEAKALKKIRHPSRRSLVSEHSNNS